MFRKKELFSLSEEHNSNYVATICKIDSLEPIEGADNLLKTIINGYNIVVTKDYKVGDIVVYIPIETVISNTFLSKFNLFSDYELNNNRSDIENLRELRENAINNNDNEMVYKLTDMIRKNTGFFHKSGRVRCIRLRNCPSNGFIIKIDTMNVFIGKDIEWEKMIGKTFDTINGDKFCWKYIPPVKIENVKNTSSRIKKMMNRILRKHNKLIPGQFEIHYSTKKLNENIIHFSPDDYITITTKVHGAAGVFSNILCKKKLTFLDKLKKLFGGKVNDVEYDNIYGSRTVVKNRSMHSGIDYYETDIWGDVNNVLKPFIIEGMTVYGEIVGYINGTEEMIQKGHDYGCNIGEWKFMPYRITETDEFGNKKEWDVEDVIKWTNSIKKCDTAMDIKLFPMELLYSGRFGDLYPDIDTTTHWNENVLEAMKKEPRFLMEEPEPMCKLGWGEYMEVYNKYKNVDPSNTKAYEKAQKKIENAKTKLAPREGIVIRRKNDLIPSAFKLKTNAHFEHEKKMHDNGEVSIDEIN